MTERNGASGPVLRSAALRDFNALGSIGRPVFDTAPQVRATIRRQLGADIAAMLAIPKVGESGETVNWHAPEEGLVVPWSSATPEEREGLRRRLQEAQARVLAHAETLNRDLAGRSSVPGDFEVYARLLPHVMRIPDESHIYAVNGKPVLTFWGFTRPGGEAADTIAALAAPPASFAPAATATVPPPAPAAPISDTRRLPWWAWLLLLLLLLALLLFGLRTCTPELVPEPLRPALLLAPETADGGTERGTVIVPGTVVAPGGTVVPGQAGATVEPGTSAGAGTQETTPPGADATPPAEDKQDKTADKSEPPTPPDVADKKDADKKDADKKTENGKGADKAEKPSVPPTPAVPPTAQNGKTPLAIPPEAARSGDASFLNGKWTSQSGLMDSRTGLPAIVEYDFKAGQGSVTIRRSDGTVCVGKSSAVMKDGRLVITGVDDPSCDDGSRYGRTRVECRQGNGARAECVGKAGNGQDYSVDMSR